MEAEVKKGYEFSIPLILKFLRGKQKMNVMYH